MTSPFGPGEPSPDEVFRRITPPPGRARWPGLLTVLVRWRAELLLVGVVAALWYWAGGLAVGMVALALAVLAAAIPTVRHGLVGVTADDRHVAPRAGRAGAGGRRRPDGSAAMAAVGAPDRGEGRGRRGVVAGGHHPGRSAGRGARRRRGVRGDGRGGRAARAATTASSCTSSARGGVGRADDARDRREQRNGPLRTPGGHLAELEGSARCPSGVRGTGAPARWCISRSAQTFRCWPGKMRLGFFSAGFLARSARYPPATCWRDAIEERVSPRWTR